MYCRFAPWLEKNGRFTDLSAQMKSESGKHNPLWYRLLHLAEQAKIELSARTSAEIDFSVEDDAGKTIDALVSVTRSEYEAVIKDAVDGTPEMLKKILTPNSPPPQDPNSILTLALSPT